MRSLRLFMLSTLIAAAVFSCMGLESVPVEAAMIRVTNNCWNGDPNYPLVDHTDTSYLFVDRHSACISADGEVAVIVLSVRDYSFGKETITYFFKEQYEDLMWRAEYHHWRGQWNKYTSHTNPSIKRIYDTARIAVGR